MSLLELVQKQPNFPKEDLTDVNAMYLGLAMSNRTYLYGAHDVAKSEYPLFTGTHNPLMIAVGELYDNERLVKAVDFGIAALEAVTLFVDAERFHPSMAAAAIYGGAIARRFELDNVENT